VGLPRFVSYFCTKYIPEMNDARILVVEDEQRLAEVLQKQLHESGFRVDVANDGYVGRE